MAFRRGLGVRVIAGGRRHWGVTGTTSCTKEFKEPVYKAHRLIVDRSGW